MGATGRRWLEEKDAEAAKSSVGIAHAKQLTFAQVNTVSEKRSEKRCQFATLGTLLRCVHETFEHHIGGDGRDPLR